MAHFLYREIGRRLLDELREKLIDLHESVVLIAPRFGGKRYLMNRLFEMLQHDGLFQVLRLNATQHTNIIHADDFRDWLAREVIDLDNRFDQYNLFSEDIFAPLDWLIAQSEKPVILLVSNVDSLSQLLARELLMKIRTLVEERKLIVALSGEDIFHKLVHGPTSEFNCTYQYFLNGFDRELFTEETQVYRQALGLHFDVDEAVTRRLYELASGQLSIMKLLLRTIIESRFDHRRELGLPISVSDIPKSIGQDLLRQPPRVINNAPECWEDLKQLLHDDDFQISSYSPDPSPLELAGIATRKGGKIRLASPLLKGFLKSYYTNKRLGDLSVSKRDFETAFGYYERLSEDERVRPSNSDDRQEIAFTIKALAAELHFAATVHPDEVIRLLFKICRYALGFREVGRLQLNGSWTALPYPGGHLSEETIGELNQLLPVIGPKPGLLPINGYLKSSTLAAIAPTEHTDHFLAVAVSDQSAGRVISTERRRLTNELLEHFVEAYKQATQIVAARSHLEMRDKHLKIANSIFDGLGSRAHNVQHVIQMAAQSLRSLGYSRVSFCLVDPERKMIKGVMDESDDRSVNVAAMTDWPLVDPKADIQPYVIKMKAPKIVPDAAREPLVNPKVRDKARLKAFAVIPLLTQGGEAIGTIHVERKDGVVPTREEVDDLLQFGRQLAIAIGQSERVNLQQSTLDEIYLPIIIVDSTHKVRYANQTAEEHLGVKSGWRDQANAECLSPETIGEEAISLIRDSLSGQRRERRITLPKDRQGTRNWETLSDVIRDSHKQILGAFFLMRDVSFSHRMYKAFNLFADAQDEQSVLARLLVAGRRLNLKWGRLYLVDPNVPSCLISYDYFGDLPTAARENFRRGGIRMMRRHIPGKESWRCIDLGKPLVFYYAPHLQDGEIYITQRGQEASVVTDPRLLTELEKRPGDFWVDLPLRRQDGHPIGKITFEWGEDRWPREFDLMEVLAEIASGTLGAFQQRKLEEKRIQAVREQTAQKIMAEMAHNIGSQLAALPLLLTRYKLREEALPSLADLNQRFARIIEETSGIINRSKERLTGVSPKYSRLDLKQCFQETLKAYLLEGQNLHQIKCQHGVFEIDADEYLLKLALNELIQNSKEASTGSENLKLCINLDYESHSHGKLARIIYRDNGPGVPPEFKEKIFEDFFTYRPGKKPGTGLGMGFVRRVVKAHSGSIMEIGAVGNGVELVIKLPVKQSPGAI